VKLSVITFFSSTSAHHCPTVVNLMTLGHRCVKYKSRRERTIDNSVVVINFIRRWRRKRRERRKVLWRAGENS